MNELSVYAIFHCNLNYSCIEEEERSTVIDRCYRPLISLARELHLPVGIEMSGYTLEILSQLAPHLVEQLSWLINEGEGELIGSGYAQIIAPLVPAEVNAANLRLGHETYQRILGRQPRVALVNEQAYSASLIPLYREAGYEAVIMEWENPFRGHPDWNPDWRFLPQYAHSSHGEIPLIWNSSIAFQKFQRYASGELDLMEYMDYLHQQRGDGRRAFPLYGNDIEVFGFRPGRYQTEPPVSGAEWRRIRVLFERLLSSASFCLRRPGQVLELLNERGAGNALRLETPGQPIPVKKQEKYNITRWATSGRDDVGINTACWRIYQTLRRRSEANSDWKELCYLWSSDFRTHITDQRWAAYQKRLKRLSAALSVGTSQNFPALSRTEWAADRWLPERPRCEVRSEGRCLVVETPDMLLRLNCRKGLTVEGAWFKGVSEKPLFGTLPHGYFPDIGLGADYYTGHVALRRPGASQITTLAPVEPRVDRDGDLLIVSGVIGTELGDVEQQIRVSLDLPSLEMRCRLLWSECPPGALRVGHITLNPEAFQKSSLFYRTCNGGYQTEQFSLDGQTVDHGAVVSYQVSASQGLGLTNGVVEVGDARTSLLIEVDQTISALLGLLSFREVQDLFFCRLEFSGLEVDETAYNGDRSELNYCLRITASRSERALPESLGQTACVPRLDAAAVRLPPFCL